MYMSLEIKTKNYWWSEVNIRVDYQKQNKFDW